MAGGDQNSFVCINCKKRVPFDAPGTKHRNHCPWCLSSIHVSLEEHDRKSECLGKMEPIAISTQKDGEWSVVHRCLSCNLIRTNRIAGDDDETALLALALRPLVNLPFPLDVLLMQQRAAGKDQNDG